MQRRVSLLVQQNIVIYMLDLHLNNEIVHILATCTSNTLQFAHVIYSHTADFCLHFLTVVLSRRPGLQ